MKQIPLKRFSLALMALTAFAVAVGLVLGADNAAAQGRPQVVSAFGAKQIQGQDAIVHVTVVVPAGQSGQAAANAALGRLGAQPLGAAPFSINPLRWDQFFDGDPNNDFVVQNYNPANEPSGGLAALLATHSTWSAAAGSAFVLSAGSLDITRCPSLVDECAGGQFFDDNNDVA